MNSKPQQPPAYRAKLHLWRALVKQAAQGITDAERAAMDALAAELEEEELEMDKRQVGA